MKQLLKITFSLFFVNFLQAQELSDNPYSSLFQLLQAQQVEQITLRADFDAFLEGRFQGKSHSAQLIFEDNASKTASIEVDLEARGKFRLMNCSLMPPIKIKVPNQTINTWNFHKKFQNFKLVTHCVEENEEAVLREYWAYKMYNQLTPKSFQVHLLKINYHNTANDQQTSFYAFLLEDTDELAARLEGDKKKTFALEPNEVEADSYRNLVFFQHLIGNPDWSLGSIRNLKLIQAEKKGEPIVIPYDFDYAGLVDAPYVKRKPNTKDTIQSVPKHDAYAGIQQELQLLAERDWGFEQDPLLSEATRLAMKAYLRERAADIRVARKLSNHLFRMMN